MKSTNLNSSIITSTDNNIFGCEGSWSNGAVNKQTIHINEAAILNIEEHSLKKNSKQQVKPITDEFCTQNGQELKISYSEWPWNTLTEWMEGVLKSHRRKVVSVEEVTISCWVGWVQVCVSSWSWPEKEKEIISQHSYTFFEFSYFMEYHNKASSLQ